MHHDLPPMHIRCQRLDHGGQGIVGYGEDEQIARSRDLMRVRDGDSWQQRLCPDAGDVTTRGAGHDVMTGPP